ncbi:MAG: phosphopantetheine-binding protein [Oscillospiraceae bacterium]|uniref:acyl carrier protein n=1 Tax=Ruminococcus sp. JL13D9 TaxID=3233381 RepID=UPI0026F4E32A|nr:phosphopantetheine-binding protein [Oscillospiraceae bacterium]
MLSKEEIIVKLKDILLVADGGNADKIGAADENTRLSEDLGLNSVNVLYLVIAIEEVFNIRFDDDTGVDTFKTVGDAADYIGGKLK